MSFHDSNIDWCLDGSNSGHLVFLLLHVLIIGGHSLKSLPLELGICIVLSFHLSFHSFFLHLLGFFGIFFELSIFSLFRCLLLGINLSLLFVGDWTSLANWFGVELKGLS